MNKKFLILVVALILMDVIDGDFFILSALDLVKIALYIVCLFMLASDTGKGRE